MPNSECTECGATVEYGYIRQLEEFLDLHRRLHSEGKEDWGEELEGLKQWQESRIDIDPEHESIISKNLRNLK